MAEQMNGYWTPINHQWKLVGFTWNCNCKWITRHLHEGSCPKCDLPLPNIKPEVWYKQELVKPNKEKAWNK